MKPLPTIKKPFWIPSPETLEVLNYRKWIASYSGGKDSTALVSWIEWLRRSGQVECGNPRLVMSDTGVEYPFLRETAERLMQRLTECGWTCTVVRPLRQDKLYNQIFGRGVTPISLRRLYGIWEVLRSKRNRVIQERKGKRVAGPIKMAVRKEMFQRFLKIQEDSGITLVTAEDIAFIYKCWEDKVYPRGWSAEDEK